MEARLQPFIGTLLAALTEVLTVGALPGRMLRFRRLARDRLLGIGFAGCQERNDELRTHGEYDALTIQEVHWFVKTIFDQSLRIPRSALTLLK
jgi:hypothetical protein